MGKVKVQREHFARLTWLHRFGEVTAAIDDVLDKGIGVYPVNIAAGHLSWSPDAWDGNPKISLSGPHGTGYPIMFSVSNKEVHFAQTKEDLPRVAELFMRRLEENGVNEHIRVMRKKADDAARRVEAALEEKPE